jgi:Na+/H+-dicarboxylate symporter
VLSRNSSRLRTDHQPPVRRAVAPRSAQPCPTPPAPGQPNLTATRRPALLFRNPETQFRRADSILRRIGVKALIYFELVTTFALLFGPVVGNLVQPGAGFDIDPQTLATGAEAIQQKTGNGELPHTVEFLLSGPPIIFRVIEQTSHAFFTIVGWVMRLAPLGALGAMAYIIGQYGIGSLASYGC